MKNKILTISIIFILLSFFIINSNVFAANINYILENGTEISVPEFPNGVPYTYCFFYDESTGWVTALVSYVEGSYFKRTKSVNDDHYAFICCDSSDNQIKYYYLGTDSRYNYWKDNTYTSGYAGITLLNYNNKSFLTSHNLYDEDGSIFYCSEPEPTIIYPAISNTAEDLSTGTFDYILVAPGTFSNTENIGLNIYNITNLEDGEDVYSRKPIFSTTLNSSSSFYNSIVVEDQTEFWYEIPRANLNIDFKNGNTYFYSLLLDGSPIQEIQATIGGLTEEDILNNNFDNLQTSINESNKELQDTIKESNKELQGSIDKQTEAIEENNKTNKNIFEKIGEILSYLNPFSENFFAYKLVELIIEGLKSLFVPSEDFFSNWLDDLNEYFGDTFGILYYPFELLVDFLNRVGKIAETDTAIISVPSFTLSFMDYSATFFEDMSYDLNTILENETFKNIHDIYLIFTDIILWLGVIYLAGKMLRSIFGGMGDEVQSRVEDSQEGERSYERYKQYQENKKRYKQENKGR